jgi:hypothetical protein
MQYFIIAFLLGILNFGHCDLFDICDLQFGISISLSRHRLGIAGIG